MTSEFKKNPNRFSGMSANELLSNCADAFSLLPGTALEGKNAPVNVFGQLMTSPDVSNLFIPYWAASKTALALSVREQELIILRSAFLFQCDYVWGHHVPVIKEAGATDEEITRVTQPIATAGWSEKEAALLMMTDQLFSHANITNELWDEIKRHYSDAQLVDIIMVCSQYLLFNSVNNVFGLQLEHDGLPNCPTKEK